MKIKLIALGKNMPAWVNEGFNEYAKRLPSFLQLDLIEIPLVKRSGKRLKNADINRLREQEGKKMVEAINSQGKTSGRTDTNIIALDLKGKQWDSNELASQLQNWRETAQDLCLLIGGPEGLSSACLEKATSHWSLSKLTLPHPLVRIMVAEQLYRAWTIITGHPYHR